MKQRQADLSESGATGLYNELLRETNKKHWVTDIEGLSWITAGEAWCDGGPQREILTWKYSSLNGEQIAFPESLDLGIHYPPPVLKGAPVPLL